MDKHKAEGILALISRCLYHIDLLLTETEKLNGFASQYPKECLEKLKRMQIIFELEIKALNKELDSYYGK